MKKLLLCVLLFVSILFPTRLLADESKIEDFIAVAREEAELFLKKSAEYDMDSDWKSLSVYDEKVTYDFNGNASGVVFRLHEDDILKGYITVGNQNGVLGVVEASFEGEVPFSWNETTVYNIGPFSYYTKNTQGEYISTRDGMNIGTQDLYESAALAWIGERSSLPAPKSAVYPDGVYRLDHTLTSISQQPYTSSCVAAASAMLIRYIDTYDSSYPDLIADGVSNSSLLSTLRSSTYFGTGIAGPAKIKTAIKKYFTNHGGYSINLTCRDCELFVTDCATLTASHINTVINQIENNDHPVVVIIGQWGYKNSSDNILSGTTLHALTVYGAVVPEDGSEPYLYAKDPWNGNAVTIRWKVTNSSSQPYFYIHSITWIQ
ncbi:MAG: hypothetical protein HUJ58_10030 [Erysipelotrichaceae bacterium]|nr:hypothetical protein [Erysipelotrichaceae bacterium]